MRSRQRRAFSCDRGVTLLELIIATAIISIGFLGFIAAYNGISKSIAVSRARTLASNFAAEKIEKMKALDYHRIIPTHTKLFDTSVTPNIAYDNDYFPPENITTSGMSFTRYTLVENVQEISGDFSVVAANADTGAKRVKITIKWSEGNQYKQISMSNVTSNPNTLMMNSSISGTVTNSQTAAAIENAVIVVAENVGLKDLTDSSGNYNIDLLQGNYTLTVNAQGYFPSAKQFSIGSNSSQTHDFGLNPMSSGTIKGTVWLNDHIVISQVVSSTDSPAGCHQEYVELYNPTTNYVQMANGLSVSVVELYYANGELAVPNPILLSLYYAVINSSMEPNGYFLIANTETIVLNGGTVVKAADAYYSPFSMFYGSDVIKSPDAGTVGIKYSWAALGDMIDHVGWDRDGAGEEADYFEGEAIDQNAGFTEGELYVRRTSTSGVTAGLGRGYDSNNNEMDFLDLQSITYPPNNKYDIEPLVSGTPAIGAIVTASDGLSGCTVADRVGSIPWAEFSLFSVATGTWKVFATSSSYITEVSQIEVLSSAATWTPNDVTSSSWPAVGYHSYILSDKTEQGFISGRVTNAMSLPVLPMTVSAGNPENCSADGRYFIECGTGPIIVTANPNNDNPLYVSLSQETTTYSGQITSGVDFMLSQGGRLKGFISRDGVNPLPNVALIAVDANDASRGEDVSKTNGMFYISDLATGTYRVQPVLDSKESSNPTLISVNITVGCDLHIGTFTVLGTLGTIMGTVTEGGDPIQTGVLIVASDSAISADPPSISSVSLLTSAIYATSSKEDGTYALEVRGSTITPYYVYGWYPTMSGKIVSYSRRSVSSVSVMPGGTTSGVDMSW